MKCFVSQSNVHIITEKLVGKLANPFSLEHVGNKVLKADFHGAFLSVVEAINPSLVGHSGIVVMERKNSFLIVTKKNRMVAIPKKGSVFVTKVCGAVMHLYGTALRFRGTDRAVHKFKATNIVK